MVRISEGNSRGLIWNQEGEKRQMSPTSTARTPLMLWFVVPAIPKEPKKRAYLKEDLTRIECIGWMSKPWLVKDEKMVRELVTGAPNQYEGTI